MDRRAILILVALLGGAHRLAGAQELSRWSLDLVAGNGRHPTQVGLTQYYPEPRTTGRATVTWRLGAFRTTTLDAVLQGESSLQFSTGEKAICIQPLNSTGCLRTFAPPSGLGLGVGVRQRIGSRLQLRGATGIGHVLSSHGSGHPFIEADAAARLTHHVAIVGGTRYMWWTEGGYATWFAPTTFGLRLF